MTIPLQSKVLAVRGTVEGVCAMLESPTPATLDRCEAALASAVSHMIDLQPELRPESNVGALDESRRLQGALRRADRLLRFAHDYHANWHSILGSMSAGYTAQGQSGRPPIRTRMSVQG